MDDNTGTGGTYGNCNNMSGIDRYIYINGTNAPAVYDSSFAQIGNGTLGYNQGASNPVIELSVSNALLGFSSTNCTQTIPMVVYFDNGTTDSDDNTPDSGTIDIGCGTPTAVTLTTIGAENNTPLLIAAAALLLVLVSGGAMLAYKRYRA